MKYRDTNLDFCFTDLKVNVEHEELQTQQYDRITYLEKIIFDEF